MSRPALTFSLCLLLLTAANWSALAVGSTYDFFYSGRLTDPKGKPYSGPIAMSVAFFRDGATATPLLTVTEGLTTVPLTQGTFQLHLTLGAADYATVFTDVAKPVFIEVTDLTHAPSAPFTRQQIAVTPYAAKVPVDNKTLAFNPEGQLSLLPTSQAQNGQFLTEDGNGNAMWAAPNSATCLASSGGTLGGALTVSSGGENLTGGLNNNSGGIISAGNITGVGSSVTGSGALTIAAGSTAQNLTLSSSTTGSVNVGSGNGTSLSVLDVGATAADYVSVKGSAAGSSPVIGTAGADANINLTLTPKGTGNTIVSSGNVGIGTSSPDASLDVVTDGASTTPLRIQNLNSAGFSAFNILDSSGTLVGGFGYGNTNAPQPFTENTYLAARGASTPLTFITNGSERFRITPGGSVGIGTTAPSTKLQVTTNAVDTTSTVGEFLVQGVDNYGQTFVLQSPVANYSGKIGQTYKAFGATGSGMVTGVTFNNDSADYFGITDHNGTTLLSVKDASGNVGIGTTSPQAALDVSGQIRVAKNTAQPFACDPAHDGTLALTHVYTMCVCNGGTTSWVQTADGSTACSW